MKPEAPDPTPGELGVIAASMNRGAYRQAADLARSLLDRNPNFGFLWKIYGAALLRQGRDALPELLRAVELSPDDADAHFFLGTAVRSRGNLAAAIASFEKAIELRPEHVAAILERANILQRGGRFVEAAAGYRRAIEIEPTLAEAHNNLGTALRECGELSEASASYRRALEIRPTFAEAHSNLGNVLRALGDLDGAVVSFRRALEFNPRSAEAHNNLGNALRDLGLLDEAAASFQRALDIDPQFAYAHSNFGNVLRDLGRLREAAASYQRALDLNPGLAEAHNNLGNVQMDLMQLAEADASFRRALALRPGYVHAHTALAMALRLQGRPAEAEASCRRALDIAPDAADSLAFLAELHADQGRFADAETLFRRAIEIEPELPAAWAGLARYRRMGEGDSWLAGAQRLAAKHLPLRQEIPLRYAIGKYFDDVKDYDQAFQSYRLANELTRRYGAMFDRAAWSRQVDRIAQSHHGEWLGRAPPSLDGSERAVFIVGMPRSGTTLAEQILASHPAVFGAGELPFWNDAAAAFDASAPGAAERAEMPAALGRAYLQQLADLSPAAARVIDKMPINYLNIGLIRAALPDARIIHMRRNPIDTCLSIYFQNFTISHAYANDLEDLAHYYTEYARLTAHWRATLPEGSMLEVPYEGLVEDTEAWSRRMIDFVGLPWDPRCLDFHETVRTVTTPSKWQVRQKISKASSGRWRNYRDFVGPLERLLQLSR